MSQNSSVLNPTPDPLYTLLQQKAPASTSTSMRTAGIATPIEGASTNDLNSALNNSAAPRVTTVRAISNSSSGLRLGTSGLRIRVLIHSLAATNASAPAYNSNVSPYTVASLISKLTLTVNSEVGTGTLYSSVDGRFLEEFYARCVTQYTHEGYIQSSSLLQPVGDTQYTRELAVAATGEHPVIVPATHYTDDPVQIERYKKYCSSSTHQKQISVILPLWLICGCPKDGILKNARSINIEIRWAPTTNLLDSYTSVAASKGGISVVSADLVTDHYVSSATQLMQSAIEKAPDQNPVDDILPMLVGEYHHVRYQRDSDIVIQNCKAFHSVAIFKLARGTTNGKAGNNLRIYSSTGQTLFGFGTAPDATIKMAADTPFLAGETPGWDSVQISWGSNDYPTQKLVTARQINGAWCHDFAQLYYEYAKACSLFGKRDGGPALSLDHFSSTAPMVLLKPFADIPSNINTSNDLVIRLTGGEDSNISVVVFSYKVAQLSPSGNLTIF